MSPAAHEPRVQPPVRLALTIGDPAGIGPEIALAAIADPRVAALELTLDLLGPASLCPAELPPYVTWITTDAPAAWDVGRVQAGCGRAALAALAAGHERALGGEVEALVTGPVSKEALHLAGERVEGQTELLARWSGVERFEMVAQAGRARVMLLTRHLPLREALERITQEAIEDHLALFNESLHTLGWSAPRLAVAGLNPHAGENGLLGSEEQQIIEPAVRSAREAGLTVHGPISPDSIFLAAREGEFEGVLALYHDQAFIPLKLLSDGRGVTWIAGLPYLRVSPVHGTAFDIAGRGVASPRNLIEALCFAADSVRRRRTARPPAPEPA